MARIKIKQQQHQQQNQTNEWMNDWMHEKLVAVNGNNINFSTEINKNESY